MRHRHDEETLFIRREEHLILQKDRTETHRER